MLLSPQPSTKVLILSLKRPLNINKAMITPTVAGIGAGIA